MRKDFMCRPLMSVERSFKFKRNVSFWAFLWHLVTKLQIAILHNTRRYFRATRCCWWTNQFNKIFQKSSLFINILKRNARMCPQKESVQFVHTGQHLKLYGTKNLYFFKIYFEVIIHYESVIQVYTTNFLHNTSLRKNKVTAAGFMKET